MNWKMGLLKYTILFVIVCMFSVISIVFEIMSEGNGKFNTLLLGYLIYQLLWKKEFDEIFE